MKWFQTKGELLDENDKPVQPGTRVRYAGQETTDVAGFKETDEVFETDDGRKIRVAAGTEAHDKARGMTPK